MIKYIPQLETRNEYYLTLIDVFERGKTDCKFKIPLSFFIKNKDLFEEIKSYINLFKKIDIMSYFNKNSFQSYESYRIACDNLQEYNLINEELYWVIQEYDRIDFEASDLENIISMVLRILRLLEEVYPHNKDIYIKSIDKFKIALEELNKLGSIVYDKEAVKYKKVFLPDSWFILPNQVLYNTGNGHKGSNLTYDFYNTIDSSIKHSKNLDGMFTYFLNLAKKIKEDGFTSGHFKSYINLIYFPVYTDTTHEIPTCHEKYTLDHLVGIVMAHAYFYKFFADMQKYCVDPKSEFNKLKEMTNNEVTDIFVRCCGFHKVESQLKKTITTSDVNYKDLFKEYIDNGWNVVFIPPIIIKRDLGIISELDMESPFVKKYMKQL